MHCDFKPLNNSNAPWFDYSIYDGFMAIRIASIILYFFSFMLFSVSAAIGCCRVCGVAEYVQAAPQQLVYQAHMQLQAQPAVVVHSVPVTSPWSYIDITDGMAQRETPVAQSSISRNIETALATHGKF